MSVSVAYQFVFLQRIGIVGSHACIALLRCEPALCLGFLFLPLEAGCRSSNNSFTAFFAAVETPRFQSLRVDGLRVGTAVYGLVQCVSRCDIRSQQLLQLIELCYRIIILKKLPIWARWTRHLIFCILQPE